MSEEQLDRSILERKEREELQAIATAMSLKAPARLKKVRRHRSFWGQTMGEVLRRPRRTTTAPRPRRNPKVRRVERRRTGGFQRRPGQSRASEQRRWARAEERKTESNNGTARMRTARETPDARLRTKVGAERDDDTRRRRSTTATTGMLPAIPKCFQGDVGTAVPSSAWPRARRCTSRRRRT